MESIRNFLKSWPGRIFLMLCLSPLVILGLESYFSGASSTNEVVKVGEQSISRSQYQDGINSRRNELIQYGIDPSAINNAELNREVLTGLINRALLVNQTNKLGMSVSDAEINNYFLKDPIFFDDNGQFSNERFAYVLNQRGITKEQLFEDYRQQMNIEQLFSGVVLNALVPKYQLTNYLNITKQARNTWVHRLPWQDYKSKVSVSSKEIENYYNEHKNELNSMAMVDLSYVYLDPKQFPVETVTEAEIQSLYDTFKASYVVNPSRKISQILVTGEKAPETMQLIQKRLKQGETFAALAKEYSEDPVSAENGGDIGTFNEEAFGEDGKKVADLLSGLEKGQVSTPVKTSFGYQIFELTDITNDGIPSLESMREELVARAQRQKQEQLMVDKITRINELATDGMSIQDIAQQEELKLDEIKNYTKVDNKTALNQPAVIDAAFDEFNIQDETVSPSIKVSDITVWVQPANYRPVMPLSLKQASDDIKNILVKDKAVELALVEAKAIAEKVNTAGIEATEVAFKPLGVIERQTPLLTEGEKAMAFSKDTPKDKLLATADVTDTGATVLVMGPIQKPSLKDLDPTELSQEKEYIREINGQQQISDYIEYLRMVTDIVENESVINEIAGLKL